MDRDAWVLLRRVSQRVGRDVPETDLVDTMLRLVQQCVLQEPRLAEYGHAVKALVRHGMSGASILQFEGELET